MITFHTIFVPIDFSPFSDAAIARAADFAARFGAAIVLMHAYEAPVSAYPGAPSMPVLDIVPALAEAAQIGLDTTVKEWRERGVDAKGILRCGIPWREIIDVARRQKADLIVMGTHGRHGVARFGPRERPEHRPHCRSERLRNAEESFVANRYRPHQISRATAKHSQHPRRVLLQTKI